MTALLEVKDVRRSFGGLKALDKVNFALRPGQIKAIIGPNGAGKTTLFNIVSGVLHPDGGEIVFKDESITSWKPFRIAGLGIARTFQTPALFLRMSVLENVMVGRHVRSKREFLACCFRLPGQRGEERSIRSAALEQLEFVGLAADANRPAGELAFGRRRLVELARALAAEPELLMLDEPAAGLNPKETDDLGRLIRKIRDRGVTILLIEHDMSLVMEISDEILVLDHGTPIAEGVPEIIQNDPKVISIYLGEESPDAAAS